MKYMMYLPANTPSKCIAIMIKSTYQVPSPIATNDLIAQQYHLILYL